MKRLWPALFCLGCASDLIVVGVPFEAEDRFAVVTIQQGEALEVFSVDAEQRNAQPLLDSIESFSGAPPLQLYAVYYDRALDEEGFPNGPVSLTPEGVGLPQMPRRALRTRVTQSGEDGWVGISESPLPEPLASLRFDGEAPCRSFEVISEVTIPLDAGFPVALLSSDEASSIVVLQDSLVTRFIGVRGASLQALDGTVQMRAQGAVLDAEGQMWIFGGHTDIGAMVVRGSRSDGPFETVMQDPQRGSFGWPVDGIWAADDGPEGRFYGVDRRGALVAARPGDLSFVELAPRRFASSTGEPAMAWLGPDEVLYADPLGAQIFRYQGGRVTEEPHPLEESFRIAADRIFRYANIPGIGVFAGTQSGTVLRRVEGEWNVLLDPVLVDSATRAFVDYDQGLLIGGRYGVIQQVLPGGELCPDNTFLGNDLAITRVARDRENASRLQFLGRRSLQDGSRPFVVITIQERP